MDLKINDEQLDQVIAAAVLQQLTPDTRERLIKQAIEDLLKKPHPDASRYQGEDKMSAIKFLAFRSVDCAVREKFTEYWKSENGDKAIQELCDDALKHLKESGAIRKIVAESLQHGIRNL